MRGIKSLIQSYTNKKEKGATSERAVLIQQICDVLFDDGAFKKILGQTHQLTIDEIREIFESAYRWKVNPQALFWKLLKEKNAEIKKSLKKGI